MRESASTSSTGFRSGKHLADPDYRSTGAFAFLGGFHEGKDLDGFRFGNGGDPALEKLDDFREQRRVAVVRAHRWFDDLVSGRVRSFGEIAKAEGITRRYVRVLIPLAFLAPDLVAAILAGTQPVDLTAETLAKRTNLPLNWAEQRGLLAFD